MALGPDGAMYVSSRFDGHVYRLTSDDRPRLYATELGVPTGLAFAPDGTLFVGDRSGSILRVSPDRHVETYATLPSSVAAFHLAVGPDDCLYVTAPTLASHDALYRITPRSSGGRRVRRLRPSAGARVRLERHALRRRRAGGRGRPLPARLSRAPTAGAGRGRAVARRRDVRSGGGIVLASNDTIWKLDVDAEAAAVIAHREPAPAPPKPASF